MQSNIADLPRIATDQDLHRALALLNALPRQKVSHPELEFAAFRIGLQGKHSDRIVVAACDLAEAVRRILQDALGGPFHPTPPDLRRICDQVRDERSDALARLRRAEEQRAQLAELRAPRRRSPEEIEHVEQIMRGFREQHDMLRNSEPSLDEIAAKYPKKALDGIGNQPPNSEAWKRYLARLEARKAAASRQAATP